MSVMFGKNTKKSSNPSTKHFSLGIGIPTNIALGPLGFLAELDTDHEDGQNPGHSRIVFCERESGTQGPPAPENPTFAVTAGDVTSGNHPQKEGITHSRQEHEPGVTSRVPEQELWDPELQPRVVLADVPEQATNGFGPLNALLRAIVLVYANQKESVMIRNKVEVLLSPIASLDTLFATLPGDIAELRRRDELIREVEDIDGQLRLLYGKPGFQQHASDHVRDVFSFLEEIQGAIFHYQMARRTAIDDQGPNPIDLVEATVLNHFRCAKQVEYRHSDRNGCLKGTRRTILDDIELWTRHFDKPSVYWLNGLAGTGKSTIAQTIAERLFADGRLGASFFCSRDFEDRSNLKFIFPTLAVQLARRHPEFRSIFVPLVQADPEIADESLYGQMNKLIVQPLVKSSISTVIVIDALDECKDDEPASAILSVLAQFVSQITNVKFFVTGRPESRIREGFRLPLLAEVTDVFVLHQIEPSQVNSDVRLFFRHNFSELKHRRRGLEGWPTDEQLDLLCERAEGLFVHAVATVRFISQRNNNPKKQLDRLLRSPESSVLEGKTKFRSNTTLDSLYASILQEAFGDDDSDGDHMVRSVLGAVILSANPVAPSTIATLLDLDAEDVFPLLLSIHSLLLLQEDMDYPVRSFHKSFPDFVMDPVRYPNPRFCVHPVDQHTELLIGCLELMNRRLKKNICELPEGVCNLEVEELRERTEQHIDQALQYSCRSWHKHLVDVTPAQALKIIPVLHQFLREKFLFWLEALSILGATRVAVDALETTIKLLNESPTLKLVRDYIRFVITFFDVIDASAPHIYHSALPLSPRTSIVRELYGHYVCPLARVVRGLPVCWEPAIATVYHDDSARAVAWSPNNRLIAVARSGSIEILDAVTLKRLNAFECLQHRESPQQLSFSPDSRLLTGFCYGGLKIWDLQTGAPVGTGPLETFPDLRPDSSTYSIDGKLLAVVHTQDAKFSGVTDFTIDTYDLLSWAHISSYRISEGRVVFQIWAHGERFRFATAKPGYITIWEVGFNESATLASAEVETLSVPDGITDAEGYLFHPPLSRLAFTVQEQISIWDARESKFVLEFVGSDESMEMSFSSDGRFFACGTWGGGANVWKDSPAGYTLHQKLEFATLGIPKPFLSPNGESIITCKERKIRLWSTNDSVSPLSSVPAQANRVDSLEFSPDATFAAGVRSKENTVEVIDLMSGDSQLTIDTGMAILCLRVTGSTVVVVDGEKIVTWNLPPRNRPLDVRANINDSVQTTVFGHSEFSPTLSGPKYYASMSPDLSCVAAIEYDTGWAKFLSVYDRSTGKLLACAAARGTSVPRFSPDGSEVWIVESVSARRWKIIKDRKSGVTELNPLDPLAPAECLPGIFPWPSCGYEVTLDGWVLNSTQKRLLWLPHHWRSSERMRTWGGRFLGLRHDGLLEFVILEFFE